MKIVERCAISETGTGFAFAKLSGGQKPCPQLAFARIVRMTNKCAKLSQVRSSRR